MTIYRADGTEYKKVVTKDENTTAHMTAKGGYTGLDNATGGYFRTPSSGLIPNVSGGSGTVGTSGWPFNYGYFKELYVSGVRQNFRYSTSEQWTGRYWLDGKKIYTKSFTFSFTSNAYDIPISNLNANEVFIDFGNSIIKTNNGRIYTIPRVAINPSSGDNQIELNIYTNKINISFGNAYSSMTKTGTLTIEYTCTNR